ncbi:MAG: hypothetical protein IKV28_04240 [Bacteroidales bacterium]|nr:hypothetical protein [Bacteroidales bacterium]
MNIQELKNDGLVAQVSLQFGKEDYADKKKKSLNKFRREADIRGFRKGQAPMSLIEKMHGHAALSDAINELISEGLNKYIQDNNLSVIGEPLPNEEKESKNDWENGENFEFVFDIALAPNFELNLSAEDKIPYYEVSATDKAFKEYKTNVLKQYGQLEPCDTVKKDDFMIADLVQGENRIENTYISLQTIAEDVAKDLFIGKKVGDVLTLNVNEVFTNEVDRAALLKMKKEELEGIDPIYNVEIKEVKNFVPAKPTQELFDQMFGAGNVADEAAFDEKLKERLAEENKQESDYRFMLDARQYLLDKTNIQLPEEFMKRWLFYVNDGKFTMEEIEKDFPLFLKDFRWQSIAQRIMKEQNLEITRETLVEQAKRLAAYQFAMYGLNNVPEEHLTKYAESLLTNEKEGRRIYEKVEENMVLDYVRATVTLDKKKATIDKLRKMND